LGVRDTPTQFAASTITQPDSISSGVDSKLNQFEGQIKDLQHSVSNLGTSSLANPQRLMERLNQVETKITALDTTYSAQHTALTDIMKHNKNNC
jgi:archaellum component FlaC